MAKKKSPTPKFMKYAGIMSGPADLSSRKGFSRVAVKNIEEKAEGEPARNSAQEKTLRPEQ
jgi:uncharacterized protein YfaQ (DUF2300 family)